MRQRKFKTGFTLVEAVLTLVILGILAATASQMLGSSISAYFNGQNVFEANSQPLIALARMERDLLSIPSQNNITSLSSTSIAYTDTSGNSNTYSFTNNTLTLNGQILANGINTTNSSFTYYDQNNNTTTTASAVISILVTMNVTQNNTNTTVETRLYPRNFY